MISRSQHVLIRREQCITAREDRHLYMQSHVYKLTVLYKAYKARAETDNEQNTHGGQAEQVTGVNKTERE